jgi:hypothetical protein
MDFEASQLSKCPLFIPSKPAHIRERRWVCRACGGQLVTLFYLFLILPPLRGSADLSTEFIRYLTVCNGSRWALSSDIGLKFISLHYFSHLTIAENKPSPLTMLSIESYDHSVFNSLPIDTYQFRKVMQNPIPEASMEAIR